MIMIEFTEEAIEQLRYERFHHPHPRVQRKMEALLLKSDDLPHHQITRILGVSENTLRQYLREYEEGGIDRLKQIHFHKPQSELSGPAGIAGTEKGTEKVSDGKGVRNQWHCRVREKGSFCRKLGELSTIRQSKYPCP